MIRKLFSDALVYTLPSILSRGISFFLLPIYTRILSTSNYGILDLIVMCGNLVNLTISLEITQGIARFYSDEKNIFKRKSYVSSAFWFSTACYVFFLVVSIHFSSQLSNLILKDSNQEILVKLAVIYIFFSGLVYFIQNQLRWELRSKQYAILSILVSFLAAAISVVFVYLLNWQLFGVLFGMVLAHLLGYVYGINALRNSISMRVDLGLLMEMLRYSAPLVPAGITVFISTYIDRMMLNHFLSLNEVGLYSLGFRLASAVSLVTLGFQKALTPLIYSNYTDEETPQKLAFIFRLFFAISLLLCLTISIFSREILWIVASPQYYSASKVIIFLVPSILLSGMYIFAPGISLAKKSHFIFWINLVGATLNTFLNWMFIPLFGFVGAAIATFLGALFVFSLYVTFSQKFYYIPYDWEIIGVSTISVFIGCLLGYLMDFESSINIFLKSFSIIFYLFFMFLIGLVDLDEIKGFIKS